MKLTKKILSLVLAAALLLGTVAIAAQAEGLTEQAGSIQTFDITSDKTDENGVTNVKPGETITIQVYMTTNYYTAPAGGDYFLWTAGVFEELSDADAEAAAKNFATTFKVTATNPAAVGSYPTGYGTTDYVGVQYLRANLSGTTAPTVVDDELVYEFTFKVKEDAVPGTKATFEIPAASIMTKDNTSRKALVYQGVNANSSTNSTAAKYAETVVVNPEKLEINIVSAAVACDYTDLDAAVKAYEDKLADKDLYENWADYEAAYDAAKKVARDMIADEAGANQKAIDDAAAALNAVVLKYKAASYAKVEEAIAAIPADLSGYTAASVKAVNDAKAAVVYGLDITKQAEVDAYADAINEAVKNLAPLGACDYTELDKAIKAYEDKLADKDLYENWADYEAAYDAAKKVARDMIADEAGANQKAIDDAAAALNAVVLKYKAASYAKVEEAIAAIPADLSGYTAASVKAVNDAKAAVVYGLDITKQAEVDAYADAINEAVKNLAPLGACNYDALDAVIKEAEALNPDDYTTTSWYSQAYLDSYLENAKGVTRDMIADEAGENQAIIDEAEAALKAAIAKLELRANLEALKAAIAAEPKVAQAYATADTWADYAEKLAAAQALVEEEGIIGESRQAEVDAAAEALDAANEALKEDTADYSAVEAAKATIPADLSGYTAASVKDVEDAVAAVVEGLGKSKQHDVDAMAAAIEEAVKNLVPLGACDYTELDKAIKAYEDKLADKDLYENWADYEAAYDAAKKVARDMIADEAGANQKAIDDAAAALNAVVLKYKAASYEKVEEAIVTIPADLSGYTPASVKAVEDAVAAVIYGLDITTQADVDAMAAAIEKAVKNLVPLGSCSIISVTPLQTDYVKGDIINLEVLCEGTDFSKIQFITESGATSTYTRTHSSVKDIYVNEDGNEVWVIAQKVPSNSDVTRYAKAKMGKVWDTGVTEFQFVPTKEDASVKSVEILLGDEAVTEFLNTDTVTIKIVTGPATRRIRLVNPVTGSTSTYSTYASVNADGTKVWTITRKYTTVKAYAFDIHTANSTNVLADSGADLTFTVNKYVAPQVPSTENLDDAVISAAVAKARILKGSTQTFTITTDKAAKQVRIKNSSGSVVYRTASCVSEDGLTKTWVITSNVYNTLGTYNYTVEALYGETWLADADGKLTFKVLY